MFHRRFAWASLFLFVICLPVSADQFDEARSLLERMAAAMQEHDYQGTFVYVQGDDVETLRITHMRVDGVVKERLVAVSGPTREVLRDRDGVRAVLSEDAAAMNHPLVTGSVFPEFSGDALRQARQRYHFEVKGEGRIAGHQGRRLAIEPRDSFRYGYELWLDQDSGLLLRWVLFDAERRTLAKLMFTDLVIGPGVDKKGLDTGVSGERFLSLKALVQGASGRTKQDANTPDLEDIPPGFTLAARAADPELPAFEHFVYSDGLASVSVYVELADEGGLASGLSRMGTTNAWSKTRGQRRITAIGEVPAITVKKFGNAFLTLTNGQ